VKYSIIIPFYSHPIDEIISIAEKIGDCEVVAIVTGNIELIQSSNILRKIECHKCGYGEAVNKGVQYSTGDYLIIMNDDVSFNSSFFEILNKMDFDVIVPTVYDYKTNEIESTHSSLDFLWYNRLKKNLPNRNKAHIPGSIFIIKRGLFDKSGGFDEDYFMYYEDIDLSLRVEKISVPFFSKDLKVCHKHSFSNFNEKRYYLQRNRILFIVKNCRKIYLPFFFIYLFTIEMFVMIYQLIKSGETYPLFARIDFLKNALKFIRKRYAHNN